MSGSLTESTRLDKNDVINCPLCFEEYDKVVPKVLQCGHTFCQGCLETYQQSCHSFGRIKCPNCRKETMLSHGRINQLTTNFLAKQIVPRVQDSIQVDISREHKGIMTNDKVETKNISTNTHTTKKHKTKGTNTDKMQKTISTNTHKPPSRSVETMTPITIKDSISMTDKCNKCHSVKLPSSSIRHWCVPCVTVVCSKCTNQLHKDHEIIVMRSKRVSSKTDTCPEHIFSPRRFICKTCDKKICDECCEFEHKEHIFVHEFQKMHNVDSLSSHPQGQSQEYSEALKKAESTKQGVINLRHSAISYIKMAMVFIITRFKDIHENNSYNTILTITNVPLVSNNATDLVDQLQTCIQEYNIGRDPTELCEKLHDILSESLRTLDLIQPIKGFIPHVQIIFRNIFNFTMILYAVFCQQNMELPLILWYTDRFEEFTPQLHEIINVLEFMKEHLKNMTQLEKELSLLIQEMHSEQEKEQDGLLLKFKQRYEALNDDKMTLAKEIDNTANYKLMFEKHSRKDTGSILYQIVFTCIVFGFMICFQKITSSDSQSVILTENITYRIVCN
ncbi:unnamed protein product [Owenia fusiformis]|uniref:Uncharacterized protein n=1 Tax=Owenia fusiformis TaxID=6347 RepID=A0A8J1T5K6_OWEFU|nr:unnamed protein product [Owenia fusiformis]